MTPDLSDAVRPSAGGVLLQVDVTPGAKEDRFPDGYEPWRGRIGVRVRAAPEEGRANRAVCALIGARFGLPAGAVSITTGQTSRQKTVALAGVTLEEVLGRLEEAIM